MGDGSPSLSSPGHPISSRISGHRDNHLIRSSVRGKRGTPYASNRRKEEERIVSSDTYDRIGDRSSACPNGRHAFKIVAADACESGRQAIQAVPLRLDGNTARRRCPPSLTTLWDGELPGFGLRLRPTGSKRWVVVYRERQVRRTVTLGCPTKLPAEVARRKARAILAANQLDGLPTKPRARPERLFREYAREFWRDYSRHWKPATQFKNKRVLRNELLPTFGRLTLSAVRRSDIMRWRDSLAARPGVFNRALPVLAVMMNYAEQLGYRPRGSNPARRIPRFRRQPMERFLSDREYRRLSKVLDQAPPAEKLAAAAIQLLIYTGARRSEIRLLRWDQIREDRLVLEDSKTGPKIIYLNAPARAVLQGLSASRSSVLVFPAKRSTRRPITLDPVWFRLRRRALLPDVRLHDLRHSFASIAIRQGMSLDLIGKLLGHALPETTARYAHLADDAILDAADRVCSSLATALGGVR